MTSEDISSVLGKKVLYPSQYDPTVLVREKRSRNREKYGIDDQNLNFVGYDNWNCYEISFLLDNGFPVSMIARIIYPCNNSYLVESKSLKLYLNSFNMTKLGNTIKQASNEFKRRVSQDLETLLETKVQVEVFSEQKTPGFPWVNYQNINNLIRPETLDVPFYNEAPEALKIGSTTKILVYSNFLRSNCKITSQPDWGTAFIYFDSSTGLDLRSLAQYLISFRNENHFHEEVCEMIYTRLFHRFNPSRLMVACQYTRRGGIDINPVRATDEEVIPEEFINISLPFPRELQQ